MRTTAEGGLLGADLDKVPLPEKLAAAPRRLGRTTAWLLVATVAVTIMGLSVPWRQNVPGRGQVIAYAPEHREQPVEATISGRVVRWFVREGERIEKGDPIVELADNDSNIMNRLAAQRAAAEMRVAALETRVETMRARVNALERSRSAELERARAGVESAEQKVLSAEQSYQAALAQRETAELNLERTKSLHENGLASKRELELAVLAARKARAEVASADAALASSQATLQGERAALSRTDASTEASLESAGAKLQKAETDAADARAKLAKLGTDIARQEAQRVHAPIEGTILSILARQGTEQVSRGQTLAVLVPSTSDRAVELWVDGNDAALIQPGAPVRLQFEGWPAVQFTGWPSVAVGTFGGRVAFVDPAGNGQGQFRVVVQSDPQEESWPAPRFLRQGVRTKGWFLLNEVSLGYELWRQFNGFPPTITPPPTVQKTPGKGDMGAKKGGAEGGK